MMMGENDRSISGIYERWWWLQQRCEKMTEKNYIIGGDVIRLRCWKRGMLMNVDVGFGGRDAY